MLRGRGYQAARFVLLSSHNLMKLYGKNELPDSTVLQISCDGAEEMVQIVEFALGNAKVLPAQFRNSTG